MRRLFRSPFYVFLIALLPIVSLLSSNINQVAPMEGLRTAVLVLLVTAVLLLLIGTLTRQWHRATMVIALFMLGFLAYGHFYKLVAQLLNLENTTIIYTLNSFTFLILLAALILLVWFRIKNPASFTPNLNIISLVMLIMPLYGLGTYAADSGRSAAASSELLLEIPDRSYSTSYRPDIYYIILDGYARADVLSAVFALDNQPFIDDLEERGFFVASESTTNYISTVTSLASSLNLQYLDTIAEEQDIDSYNLAPMTSIIQNNQLIQILESLNYETISISSGYDNTEVRQVDHYLTSSFRGVNAFETLVLQHTPVGRYFVQPGFLLPDGLQYAPQRDRIRYSFDTLANTVPDMDSPKFVLAHIVTPHPPFIFGPNGESIQPDYAHTIGDGDDFPGTREEYIEGYRNQVTYINKLLVETVDQILAQSTATPIIVIQSDHGSGAYLSWASFESNHCLKERAANFTAVLTPDNRAEFYDSITPVNIFRILLNSYFETDFEQLPDRNYFVIWHSAYNLTEITGQIESSNACITAANPGQ